MIVPKNLSPSGLDLQTVQYPKHILDAAGTATPGADVTFEEALRASIRISQASPTKYWEQGGERFPDGPFGALRLALEADKMIRLLLLLKEMETEKAVETLLTHKGLVASLGWNSVNGALDEGVYRDEDAHGEMVAMRNAGKAVPIPVAALPDQNVCFLEASSADNCDACKERNRMWGATAMSISALLTRQVLESIGFDEGTACKIDDRDANKPHIAFGDLTQPQLDTTFVYVPGMNQEALRAFEVYNAHGKAGKVRLYQPDFSQILADQQRLHQA